MRMMSSIKYTFFPKTKSKPKFELMSCEKDIWIRKGRISVGNSQSVNGHITHHNVIMIIEFNCSCKNTIHSFFDKNNLTIIMMVIVITLAEYFSLTVVQLKDKYYFFLLWECFATFCLNNPYYTCVNFR